MAQIIFGV